MFNRTKNNQEDMMVVAPFANLYEKENDIVIAVEMPGVVKSSLNVNLDGNQLIIKGKKDKENIDKEYTPLYQERRPAAFERRFEINTQIDAEKIKAEFKDGILKVSLAKAEAVQPRKIAIKT